MTVSVLELSIEWNVVTNRTILILELLEANAADLNSSLARRGSGLRMQIVHKHVLVIGEGVLNVTIMKSKISSVVLSITGRGENDCIRDTDFRRSHLDHGVIDDLRGDFKRSISHLEVTDVIVLVAATHQSRVSTTIDWSARAVEHLLDLRVWIVSKLDLVVGGLSTIEGDFVGMTHVLGDHKGLRAGHGRRTAVES